MGRGAYEVRTAPVMVSVLNVAERCLERLPPLSLRRDIFGTRPTNSLANRRLPSRRPATDGPFGKHSQEQETNMDVTGTLNITDTGTGLVAGSRSTATVAT